jgi:16S rRNA (guanine966-N2)-methyltransferase
MRVIAGKYRSRRLQSVPGADVRPTSDRLRETLFNVLAASYRLEDSIWIDAYAGTGAIGIEALSRGARQIYFVDASQPAAAVIRKNLRSLGILEGFEVVEREAEQALRLLDSQAVACDFCFLDPPYRLQEEYDDCLGFLSQSRLITPASLVIAEHDKHFDPGDGFGSLKRFRALRQGDAVLGFYRKQ